MADSRVVDFVELAAQSFEMGSDDPVGYPSDGEGPKRLVELGGFSIATTAVTNQEWAAFVDATGYLTVAEQDGWSFVFAGLLPDDFPPTRGVASAPWWRKIDGANWQQPHGPQSRLDDVPHHPVVHVSWIDAEAFCAWLGDGARLPTEAEWEFAARGGLVQKRFPWGDDMNESGQHWANVWQGSFPDANTLEDGYYGTAPAAAFAPNGYGLYNMAGNVWEWCADWFDVSHPAERPLVGPKGPATGTHRVMRGGSYLCHESYCYRFRVAARSSNTPDSTTGNLGFRVARSG